MCSHPLELSSSGEFLMHAFYLMHFIFGSFFVYTGSFGLMLITFMTIHLFHLHVCVTVNFYLRPPPYLINFAGALTLNLFWVYTLGCTQV